MARKVLFILFVLAELAQKLVEYFQNKKEKEALREYQQQLEEIQKDPYGWADEHFGGDDRVRSEADPEGVPTEADGDLP